jgi:hypothetical protein
MARQDTSRAQHHRLHHACGASGGAGSALLCYAMLCFALLTVRSTSISLSIPPSIA